MSSGKGARKCVNATFVQVVYVTTSKGRGDISFIVRGTISHLSRMSAAERWTKYDIVTRAMKLILPSLECENLLITNL